MLCFVWGPATPCPQDREILEELAESASARAPSSFLGRGERAATAIAWSVTWTGGCAPGAARRQGDPRTGVSLPVTLHHNMRSADTGYRRPPNGLVIPERIGS